MNRIVSIALLVGGVLLAKNLSGLYLFENLKRALARRGREQSYAAMIRAAATAKPFACHLDVSASEFFVTENPMESARVYLDRTGQAVARTWPDVAPAILELCRRDAERRLAEQVKAGTVL